MERRRFLNPGQPQTLLIAVYLLYFNAGYLLFLMLINATFPVPYLVLVAAGAAAGYGIANERKWGYGLGIAMAILPFLMRFDAIVQLIGYRYPFGSDVLSLLFEIALVALLLHPQSRDYQRIWFK
ncbi:MAG TPA: hypothetical protein VL337_04370 [Acidimicrobiales bacterium]|nr:hypothetical protein [Acidimicrobiales bacterium]